MMVNVVLYSLLTAALPPLLTLPEALDRFHRAGFDLLLAEAQVKSAEADVRTAQAVANPQISATVGRVIGNYDPNAQGCTGCSPWLFGGQVSEQGLLSDVLFGKLAVRSGVAKAALQAARMQRKDAERTLTQGVKAAFVLAATSQGAVRLAEDASAMGDETLQIVQIRYKAGAVAEADVARAETAALEAAQAMDVARQSARTSRATLAFLIGERETSEYQVDDALLKAPLVQVPTDASSIATALARRPDIRATLALQQKADIELQVAHRQLLPDWQLSAAYTQQGNGQNALQPPTLSFNLSWTLPLAYQFQGEMQKARADAFAQEVTLNKIHAQVAADVTSALATLRSGRTRVDRMRSRLLESAQRARDLVRVQYQKGAASLLELLDAQRTVNTVNGEYLQSLNDYWNAVFQLEAATATEIVS